MAIRGGESKGNAPHSDDRLPPIDRRFGSICRHPLIFMIFLVLLGGGTVASVDVTDYYFSSDNFCAFTCHVMEAIKPERKRGQRQHAEALESGASCIACHYNLAHKEVEPSDAFLKAIGEQ